MSHNKCAKSAQPTSPEVVIAPPPHVAAEVTGKYLSDIIAFTRFRKGLTTIGIDCTERGKRFLRQALKSHTTMLNLTALDLNAPARVSAPALTAAVEDSSPK